MRLTASSFLKHVEDMDIRYLLGIDPDCLLAPYLKGGYLFPKAENYTLIGKIQDWTDILGTLFVSSLPCAQGSLQCNPGDRGLLKII